MTIARSQVVSTLENCIEDQAQAERVRQWAETSKQAGPDAPGLDSAAAALLFAAALGDSQSWQALTSMQPTLVGLDANDMPAVLDRLFTESQP